MSVLERLKSMQSTLYTLPDSKKELFINGSSDFVQDMKQMLDIMVHSPTALKILNHNADLERPLIIEEFQKALDFGRNTGKSIQLAHKNLANGDAVSKYAWLTLVPHEFKHSYNAKIEDSIILQSLAYALVNEVDAQAIEGLVALELNDWLEKNKETVPGAKEIQEYLNNDPKVKFFKKFFDEANGTDSEKKKAAMEEFVKAFSKLEIKDGKKTFGEFAYKTAIERNTTENGWIKCSDEELKKIEGCLTGKMNAETAMQEPWMKGRKKLPNELPMIHKEWPTFCQRIMDGTFNTNVIQYGENIRPSELMKSISPQLSAHMREIGVMKKSLKSVSHELDRQFAGGR